MNTIPAILGFGSLGTGDLLLIAFIFLLLFGSKKLPELFRAFGQSVKEFKKASSDVEDSFRSAMNEEDRKRALANGTPPAPARPAVETSRAPEQKV